MVTFLQAVIDAVIDAGIAGIVILTIYSLYTPNYPVLALEGFIAICSVAAKVKQHVNK